MTPYHRSTNPFAWTHADHARGECWPGGYLECRSCGFRHPHDPWPPHGGPVHAPGCAHVARVEARAAMDRCG